MLDWYLDERAKTPPTSTSAASPSPARSSSAARPSSPVSTPPGKTPPHVLTLVAFGGVGKSALVARWLDRMAADDWRGAARVLDWSFYSQGSEDQNTSAEPFIDYALRFFGDPDPKAGSLHDRGARLAGLIRKRADPARPRRHRAPAIPAGPAGDRGPPQGPRPRRPPQGAGREQPGLCVVTTRERIADLAGSPSTAPQIPLESSSPARPWSCSASSAWTVGRASCAPRSKEFRCHALTLTLLGNFLRRAHKATSASGARSTSTEPTRRQGGHAFRVIAAYARWLGEGPELAILRLLGLFDRPADAEALKALRAAPRDPGAHRASRGSLGGGLAARHLHPAGAQPAGGGRSAGAGDPRRPSAGARLLRGRARERTAPTPGRKATGGSTSTCARQRRTSPTPWKRCSRSTPPSSTAAGRGGSRRRMDEVYWRRIQRGNEFYSCRKLGAFGSELTALAGFFDRPWSQPSARLTAADQAFVLNAGRLSPARPGPAGGGGRADAGGAGRLHRSGELEERRRSAPATSAS